MKSICPSLAALAVLGLSATAHAGDQVPFRAHGEATGTAEISGNVERIVLDISVQATHLGSSTGSALYFLNLTDLTFTGTFDATGSNGKNTVFFSAEGQLTPTGDPCAFDFVQTFTVTGGTGAFTNATGGGTSTGQFNACEISVDTTFTGTISRPHSGG